MTSPRIVLPALAVLLFLLMPPGQTSAQDEDSKGTASHRVTTAKGKIHRAIKRRLHPAPPEAILLKDLATGRILFEQHATERMPPASLTKIMSAIVILSEGNLDDAVMISRRISARI